MPDTKVRKAEGPFVGPDIEFAKACAMIAVADYATDSAEEIARMLKNGIWNDHVAVQAAWTAIRHIRKHGLPRHFDDTKG